MLSFDKSGISGIMVRKAIGDITPEEQTLLDLWLDESEYNRSAYERFMSAEGRVERERLLSDLSADDAFIGGVYAKIRRRNRRKLFVRAASAAVVAAAISTGVYIGITGRGEGNPDAELTQHRVILSLDDGSSYELNDDTEDSEWQQLLTTKIENDDTVKTSKIVNVKVEVPQGVNYKIRLSDGTLVWLNAESQIEYPNSFTGPERRVNVRGEAYFEVAHNPDQPFVVTTSDQVGVQVLGTRFNVSCYDDADCTAVTLEQGSVSVNYHDRDVVLEVDQQAVIDRYGDKIQVHKVDASAYSAWKNGMFDFRSVSLDEILSSMSRWYGIDFVFDNVDLSELGLLTLNVDRGDDFSHVENIMERITDLEFRTKGNTVYVSR